jgi:cation diffusion facilitator CzcD-associated flavoprotein CzcO
MHRLIGIFVGFVFTLVIGAFIIGGFWNYQMYRECRADGHKAYQCKAMLQNPSYLAIDDMSAR